MTAAALACKTFGHSWVVRVSKGRLAEVCSTCGAAPEEEA